MAVDDRAGKAAGGQRAPLSCGSCVALRATSPALLATRGPSQNSLRSLRSLRSDSCDESDARSALRARPRAAALLGAADALRPPPARVFAIHRPLFVKGRRHAGIEPASRRERACARAARCGLDARFAPSSHKERAVLAKPWAGAWRRASAAPSSAGRVAGARSALRELTRRSCLSVESAANAASSAAGPRDRAAQGVARRATHEPQLSADGHPPAALLAPTDDCNDIRIGPPADLRVRVFSVIIALNTQDKRAAPTRRA